jgi:hypothetical protein
MNTRYRCPSCQKGEKTFSRYIDMETGEQISPEVGRCSRESNCGYHYTPKQYFRGNNISIKKPQSRLYKFKAAEPRLKPISFIPPDLFKASLKGYERNCFVTFLIKQFGAETAGKLVSKYFIGSSKRWPGSSIFWQIDALGRIRSGKVMLYDPVTGKRSKDPYKHPTWAHTLLELSEFSLQQCLFGEHLIKTDIMAPIAIVESEKTAIIASAYLPDFIWLACGGMKNLSSDRFSVLRGRNVILYPDLNAFEAWTDKSNELSAIARVSVSDLLESKATNEEKSLGLDLADYLLRFSPQTDTQTLYPIDILISDITEIPCETMTGREFNNAIIAWVKTNQGGDFDILFDEFRNPLFDECIMERVANFYNKTFVEVLFNGSRAFAQINQL